MMDCVSVEVVERKVKYFLAILLQIGSCWEVGGVEAAPWFETLTLLSFGTVFSLLC